VPGDGVQAAVASRFGDLVYGTDNAAAFSSGVLERALARLRAEAPVALGGSTLGDAEGLASLTGGVSGAGALLDPASALAVQLRESHPDFFSETVQLLLSAERRLASVEAVARGCSDGAGAAGSAATAEARLRKPGLSLRDAVGAL